MKKNDILIVEDNYIIANDIKQMLISLGYNVIGMESTGKGAVKKAEELIPDLILMDIQLSDEMNGLQAAEKILKNFDINIVYTTAYTKPNVLDIINATKPFGYLHKPFIQQELFSTIENLLYKNKTEKTSKDNLEENCKLSKDSMV